MWLPPRFARGRPCALSLTAGRNYYGCWVGSQRQAVLGSVEQAVVPKLQGPEVAATPLRVAVKPDEFTPPLTVNHRTTLPGDSTCSPSHNVRRFPLPTRWSRIPSHSASKQPSAFRFPVSRCPSADLRAHAGILDQPAHYADDLVSTDDVHDRCELRFAAARARSMFFRRHVTSPLASGLTHQAIPP